MRGVRSPLVGRAHELGVLAEILERAVIYGAPQLVTVVGNQGTGKSRLVAEWTNRLARTGDGPRVYHGRASERGPSYGAIARLLRDRFQLGDGEEAGRTHERFRAECSRVFGDRRVGEVLHFLGSYLGLRFADSPFVAVFEDDPVQHDQIARTVLRRFLELDAGGSPLVLVIDDVQWADDETLNLLRELGEGLAGSPVMLVVCTRPELFARAPLWGTGQVDHTRLELRNLPVDDAEALLRNLLARADVIPDELLEDAVEMTGGNPFFLEELVRVMIANGTIDVSTPRWHIDAERALQTELPISVEEAIEARISALSPVERDLLAKACVLGNVFWTGALVVLTRQDDVSAPVVFGRDEVREEISRMLADLMERDYLLKMPDSTIPGEEEYVFKHNLERELIAKPVDPGRLRKHNLLCAQWFEAKPGERNEEQLEFLAQLYERAGSRRRAAAAWIAAGDRARERYANEAAAEYYHKGIKLFSGASSSAGAGAGAGRARASAGAGAAAAAAAERGRDDAGTNETQISVGEDALAKIEALHNLGDVESRLGEHDKALGHFQEMLRMAWLLDHRAKGAAAHGRIGRIYRGIGDYAKAQDHLKLAYQMFTREGDRRGVAAALDDIARVETLRGAFADALEHGRHALALRRGLEDKRSIAVSLSHLGGIFQAIGAFDSAMDAFQEALGLRMEVGDKQGISQSHLALGTTYRERGEFVLAKEELASALALAREIGDRSLEVQAAAHLGAACAKLGDGIAAQQQFNRAGELARQLGNQVGMAEVARLTAEALLAANDAETAGVYAQEALTMVQHAGLTLPEGVIRRVVAEVAAAGGLGAVPPAEVVAHFERSVQILESTGSELELARTLAAFARYRTQQGLTDSATQLDRRAEEIFRRLRSASEGGLRGGPRGGVPVHVAR